MMTKKYFPTCVGLFGIACLIFSHTSTLAQTASNKVNLPPTEDIKPLRVGDKMPDVFFENILYHSSSSAKLSDWKGKFVILDFWSSWCGACISLFPHMDSLQRKFGDKLQIILVNGKSKLSGDDEKKITGIMDRVRSRSGVDINLPVVYDCPALDKYFLYAAIPHEIWINDRGEVAHITGATEISYANIQSFVNGQPLALRTKRDIMDFDSGKPLFVDGNAGDGNEFLFRSILTGTKEGEVAGTGTRRSGDKITGFYMFNKPFMTLLTSAYSDYYFQRNRIISDLNASLLFPPNDERRYQYLFCYDLSIPPSAYDKMQSYMQADVERYFQIEVKKEEKEMVCYILKSGKDIQKAKSKGGEKTSDLNSETFIKYFRNTPLKSVVQTLNNTLSKMLIDESEVDFNIDIKLPKNLSDDKAVLHALESAGFDVKEEKRKVEVTLIQKIK